MTRADPTITTVLRKYLPKRSSNHAERKFSRFQSAGNENGEAKISRVVLNDDSSAHSSGATTTTDQIANTTCDTDMTRVSPPERRDRLMPASPCRGRR